MLERSYLVGFLNGGVRVEPTQYDLEKALLAAKSLCQAATCRIGFQVTQLESDGFILLLGSSSVNVRAETDSMIVFYRELSLFVGGLDEVLWQGDVGKGETLAKMRGFASQN